MNLEQLRNEIDNIDNELIDVLKKRMKLIDRIADAKYRALLPTENREREREILQGAAKRSGDLAAFVSPVMESVLTQSRAYQDSVRSSKHGRYALLGAGLTHSYSPEVHAKLGLAEYGVLDISREELEETLRCGLYSGFNITAPYKSEVIQYCDEVSDTVLETGSANTVVRRPDGKLCCYNTDLSGFLFLVKLSKIDIEDKKVVILGSGATSKTVQTAVNMLGARELAVISRTGEYNYDNLDIHDDAEVLINTTPVGTYPHNLETLVHLDRFPSLEGVIDVIYNPHRTMIIMEAEQRGIKNTDGLPMLIFQAKASEELFVNTQFFEDTSLQTLMVYHHIRREKENVILIGMPGSGKSTVGRLIAKQSGKRFIDTDAEMKKTLGRSAAEIIVEYGEGFFRRVESMIIASAGKETSCVIATGGGAVTTPENYFALHQNGRIYCLKRDLRLLETDGRPLSVNVSVLEQMLAVRQADYSRFADVMVNNNGSVEDAAKQITEDFDEISYY